MMKGTIMSDGEPATIIDVARRAIETEAAGVLAVAAHVDESFVQTVELLAGCVGKVFITGSGTSGAVARRMVHLLSVCGTPSVFAQPMDALHGSMGAIVDGDVLIAISHGGESDEVNDLARRVRARNVPIVSITSAPESTLSRLGDVTVVLADADVDPGGVIAMGSTLMVAVWGDALAYVLMRRRGYGWERVLETHPAGAVGQIAELPESLPFLPGAGSPVSEG